MPPFVGVGVKVTPVPAQIAPPGTPLTDTDGATADAIESVPKLVPAEPVAIPTIPRSVWAKILPVDEPTVFAVTCRLAIVIASI